jgi:PhnB protein
MEAKTSTTDRELRISRLLNADINLVWEVWTDPDHLKNWWGPNGFTNSISKMDIQPGGEWRLVMHGPDGKDYNNKSIFKEVIRNRKLVYEHFNPNFITTVEFEPQGEKTLLKWHMLFESRELFENVVRTHKADQGLQQNVEKLDAYLGRQMEIRQHLKTTTRSRTSTYLNFPDKTEEAFKFYRTVFRSEFGGGKIQRFGDFPPQPGMPPLNEKDKKLVLHIELPILGGHVLMGTDAPESFGFSVIQGNAFHINLEPDTREEATRLFEALSEGGKITMPLQDMFWGAYYGSCTDKYGVNWMVNHTAQNH